MSEIKKVKINKDIWFYPVEDRLEFTVYTDCGPILFEIPLKKIIKYLRFK